MTDPLEEIAVNLGAVPRRFSRRTRRRLIQEIPSWVYYHDLIIAFRGQRRLLEQGVLRWGALVQANSSLFDEDEEQDVWGMFIFRDEDTQDAADIDALIDSAHALYGLRELRPGQTKPERVVGQLLANEHVSAFGLAVPMVVSPIPCALSSVWITREHLPRPYLRSNWLPLLVSPTMPKIAMPVPKEFWTAALRQAWLDEELP